MGDNYEAFQLEVAKVVLNIYMLDVHSGIRKATHMDKRHQVIQPFYTAKGTDPDKVAFSPR